MSTRKLWTWNNTKIIPTQKSRFSRKLETRLTVECSQYYRPTLPVSTRSMRCQSIKLSKQELTVATLPIVKSALFSHPIVAKFVMKITLWTLKLDNARPAWLSSTATKKMVLKWYTGMSNLELDWLLDPPYLPMVSTTYMDTRIHFKKWSWSVTTNAALFSQILKQIKNTL